MLQDVVVLIIIFIAIAFFVLWLWERAKRKLVEFDYVRILVKYNSLRFRRMTTHHHIGPKFRGRKSEE